MQLCRVRGGGGQFYTRSRSSVPGVSNCRAAAGDAAAARASALAPSLVAAAVVAAALVSAQPSQPAAALAAAASNDAALAAAHAAPGLLPSGRLRGCGRHDQGVVQLLLL